MGTFSLLACRPEAETLSQMACGGDPISPPQLLVLPTLAPGPVSPGLWCQGRAGDSVGGGGPGSLQCVAPPAPPQGVLLGPGAGVRGPPAAERSEKATVSPSAPYPGRLLS